MERRLISAILISFLSACGTVPNTGLSGRSEAAINTSGDPGVFGALHWQAVNDRDTNKNSALFVSIHPGANDGGLGTTNWTYVRGVEVDVDQAIAGKIGLSDPVIQFLNECAPALDPSSDADRLRSGILRGKGKARLILTKINWDTAVGPGPNKFDTVRIENARLQVFGASAAVPNPGPVELDIRLSIGNGSSFSEPVAVLERSGLHFDPSLVSVDCKSKSLNIGFVDLGETGWLPRGSTNNIQVEVVEK